MPKFTNTKHFDAPARHMGIEDDHRSSLEVVLTKKEASICAWFNWQFVEVRMTRRKLRSLAKAILKELDR